MTNKTVKIPESTAQRLSIYLRGLALLAENVTENVSSNELGEYAGVNPAQVRKDLAYFGQFGIRGQGYSVQELKSRIAGILGTDQAWKVALIGIGNLGKALAAYKGFDKQGFQIAAIFDTDEKKIGKPIRGINVQPMQELTKTVTDMDIRIAIIAIPAETAQHVADALVQAGILCILNFAPARISVPKHIKLRYVDLSTELESLSFYLTQIGRLNI
jgi:redox-sensing transcriptional repressor